MNEDNYFKMIYEKYVEEQKSLGLWIERDNFFDEMKNSMINNPITEKKKKERIDTPDQKRKKEEYFKKLHYDIPVTYEQEEKEIVYSDAAKEVYSYLDMRLKGDVKLSESDKIVYRKLTKYFIGKNDEDFLGDLNKGICLFGDVGTGKTIAMEVFKEFTKSKPNKFKTHDMKEIARDVQENGVKVIPEYTRGICCYDDVGYEETAVNFGNKICIFTEIVNIYYEKFRTKGTVFHITTNLGINTDFGFGLLSQKYDKRVIDRLREMMNFIELTGYSKRS
jgi:DNA replication protein DnaC